ncbi:MAG: hypothetical protein U0Z17_03520 [Bacteroidales bacterium]
MNRKQFLQALAIFPLTGLAMNLNKLKLFYRCPRKHRNNACAFRWARQPIVLLSRTNLLEGWQSISNSLPAPKAILCISAHWETKGTFVTAMELPPTIHDFGGFPQALFDVQFQLPEALNWLKKPKS